MREGREGGRGGGREGEEKKREEEILKVWPITRRGKEIINRGREE